MSENFVADDRYQQIAEAYALDAIDFARKNFRLPLDWQDSSIKKLEAILDIFHNDLRKARPTDETIQGFAKLWGSYLGEVYRRNYGATWGVVTLNSESFPGLQTSTGLLFWPWGRAEKRLREGPEANVWHYYLTLPNVAQPSA